MKIAQNRQIELTVALFYLFYFAMVGVYVIFMPKVLKDIGYSSVEIGLIYAASPFMRFLLPFLFKHYIALTNKLFKSALVATFIITVIFFATIKSFYLYLIINLLFGGAMGAVLPFVETIALEYIGKERYGKVRLWGSVGFSLVAFVLAKVLYSFEIALYFLVVSSFFTMFFGLYLAKYNSDKADSKTIKENNKEFSLTKYWAFWASVFLFQFSFGGFYNFFTIYETSNGVKLDIVSYLWIFGVACEIVMLIFQGPLLAKYNLLTLLNIATLSATIRWLLLAFFPQNIAVVAISQATHALSFALYYSAIIAYVYSIYSQKKLAQQFLLGVGFGLGGASGAAIAGVVYKITPSGLFIFESFVALFASLLLVVHKRRKVEYERA
jgi:PPP family 3-phenylpropionic acid transporter